MKNQEKAYIFAILAILLWSTSASAFKLTLRYANFNQLLFLSSLTSLIVIFVVIIAQRKMPELFKIRSILPFILLGFLNPFLYYLILFKAYSLIPAQLAQPLNFVWPIMTVIISIPILKQRISFKSIVAIFISFLGVIIISAKGNFTSLTFDNPFGIALALFSSVVWALFWVVSIKMHTDPLVKLFYSFLFGTIFVLIYSIIFTDFSLPSLYGIIGSLYIGFFEMGITFIFWYHALKLSSSTAKVNNLIYITPFLSLLFIALVIKEKILPSTFVGLLFILIGIILQNVTLKKTALKDKDSV